MPTVNHVLSTEFTHYSLNCFDSVTRTSLYINQSIFSDNCVHYCMFKHLCLNIFTQSLLFSSLFSSTISSPSLLPPFESIYFAEFHLRSLYFTVLQLKSTTHVVKLWKLEFNWSLPSFNIACSKTKMYISFLYIAVLQLKLTTSSLICCMLNIRMETSICKLCMRS